MSILLIKIKSVVFFALLLLAATVSHGIVFFEDFEQYDVENPSDFSTNGVPLGIWVPSSTAANATRIFDTANYGATRLWISNVNGTSITSAGINVESNTQYRLSVCLVMETYLSGTTGTASYDILFGSDAATAVSLIGGPVEVAVRGDDAGGSLDNTFNDQITSALFNVGDVAPGEKVFLVFTRVSASNWLGVDNVTVNKTRHSAQLEYSYDLLDYPGNQDLDGNGTDDFRDDIQMPVNDKGFGVMTSVGDNKIYRTDASGSIWRENFLDTEEYTVDFAVNISTNAGEGSESTFGLWAVRSPMNDGIRFQPKQTGFYTDGVGSGEDNTGWHTYRITRSVHGFQAWRDNQPITAEMLSLTSSLGYSSLTNLSWIGDWGGALGGEFSIDYYRIDPTGAYAPTPDVNGGTRMQWGLDYTSGNVADQNGGVVEDDTVFNHDGAVHWNSPDYSRDTPNPALLQYCTGIGSFDLETTGHASVQSIADNFISLDEVLAEGGLTMEVWAKQTSSEGTNAVIMGMQDAFIIASESDKYKVVINSFSNPGPELAIPESEKNTAGWTHFAAILRDVSRSSTNYNATVELWINGKLKGSLSINDAPQIELIRPVEVGSAHTSPSGIYRWDGYIYEPRISLGALEPGEFTYKEVFGTIILLQ